MSDDKSLSAERSLYEEIGSLKQQLQSVKQEVDASKIENKGWVNRWGAYLGIVASVFAVPIGLRQVVDAWYQHANVNIQSQPLLTIRRDLTHNTPVFEFFIHASNHGNKDGQVVAGSAHLWPVPKPSGRDLRIAQDHFSLADEGAPEVRLSLVVVPKETPKSIRTSVDFGNNVTLPPGSYQLEITLNDEDGKAVPKVDLNGKTIEGPLRFCFPIDAMQINDLQKRPIVLAYSEEVYSGCQVLLGGQT